VETLGSRQVYANTWMAVREDVVRRADGSTGVYAVIETPDNAVVIPADGDRLHLVEQHRHPVAGRRWEFPSGNLEEDRDDDLVAAAARELREETGLRAGRLTLLGSIEMAPSMVSQRCHVFLATALTEGEPARDPAEQDMRSTWFSRDTVEQMLRDGTLNDAKSLAAYSLLQLHRPGA